MYWVLGEELKGEIRY